MRLARLTTLLLTLGLVASGLGACSNDDADLVVYSGRNPELVRPLLERFAHESGLDIEVRYGQTAELAAAILEEGSASPADVFFAQDAGALGALNDEGRLAPLPEALLQKVPAELRSPDGTWVGTSGRARTLAYNPERVSADELPDTVQELTDPKWRGRIAWAPTNGSFQAFVTALRVLQGDDAARQFLEGVAANDPEEHSANIPVVQAVGRGDADVGLVNHYYVPRLKSEDPDLDVENHFFSGGDPGGIINVAGLGVLDGADHEDAALELVRFMLAEEAQQYFADETFEYPLVDGVEPPEGLPELSSLEPPDLDLSDLDDLRGTLELLTDTGVL